MKRQSSAVEGDAGNVATDSTSPPTQYSLLPMTAMYYVNDGDHNPVTHILAGIPSQHPENPRRSVCLLNMIKSLPSVTLVECEREATSEEIEAIHSKELIYFVNNAYASMHQKTGDENCEVVLDLVPRICRGVQYKSQTVHYQCGYFCFDTSTPIGKHTAKTARIAAGIAIDAAKLFLKHIKEEPQNCSLIYALCRPPGHHATYDKYGGYCYFNNAALAANILTQLGRVVVLDVDYHHGNGTQDIFYERDDVYYISIHADPEFEYPNLSGGADELGIGKGLHYNRNFPLPVDTHWPAYKTALDSAVSLIFTYDPALIVVSLGLDAADGDPICNFHLKPEDFYEMGKTISGIGKPVLVIQEGGYSENEMLGPCGMNFLKALRTKSSSSV